MTMQGTRGTAASCLASIAPRAPNGWRWTGKNGGHGQFRIGGPQMKTRSHLAAPLLTLSLAAATAAWAQTVGKPPEQLGKVSFANSCAPAVQATFERGVALMHSFWFQEAERTFRDVLERDPACAIATWGIATM